MLPIKKLTVSLLTSVFVLLLSVAPTFAATAFVFPASGIIKDPTFLVSIFVESDASEPAIASANIKLSYPTNVSVVKIDDGDFDTTLEKNDNPTNRTITINAVNNAGNYKTGKVKLASIEFTTTAQTGTVNLNIISSESSIVGEDGSQLLDESIPGVFTIQITSTTGTETDTTTTGGDGSETTTDTTTEGTGSKGGVPETGPTSNFLFFLLISTGLIGLGILSLRPKTAKR